MIIFYRVEVHFDLSSRYRRRRRGSFCCRLTVVGKLCTCNYNLNKPTTACLPA